MIRFFSLLTLILGLWGAALAAGFQAPDSAKVRDLISTGKFGEAEKMALTILETKPTDVETIYQLGRAIFFQDRFTEAVTHFEKVASALPTFAGAQKFLGDSFSGLGDFMKAELAYTKAMAMEPKEAEYVLDVAKAQWKQGKTGSAEASFRRSLEINPASIPANYELSLFLASMNRFREAETWITKALALDPKNAYGWSLMGEALRRQKFYSRSEDAFYQALEIDSKRVRALDGLSRLFMDQELWKDAEVVTRKLIDAEPKTLSHYLRLANLIDYLKRYPESEAIYKQLIRDHPKYAEPHMDYGISLWRQDRNKEAEEFFKSGIAVDPNRAWFQFTYGNFLRQQKRLKEAKAAYEAALKIDPGYQEAKDRLDLLKLEMG